MASQKDRIDRYLDTNGDGTGTKSAIGNYSDAGDGETIFYIQPPDGKVYRLTRLLVHVEDSGTFDSGSYGNGITLTNGITIRTVDDSGTVFDMTAGLPVKTNPHWNRLCFDATVSSYGIGNETLNARWTFEKAGSTLWLDGTDGKVSRFEIVLNDDFSGLVDHTFLVQGYVD